jgi:Protein of unknown function (DUF4232)
LEVTLMHSQGAVTGEVGGYLRFANIGHAACKIGGWPKVMAITDSGQRIRALRAIHGTMLGGLQYAVPPLIRLAPGAAAYAVLAAGDQPASGPGRCPTVRLLQVFPPTNSRHFTMSARLYGHVYLPACTSASGITEIEVSAIVRLAALAH